MDSLLHANLESSKSCPNNSMNTIKLITGEIVFINFLSKNQIFFLQHLYIATRSHPSITPRLNTFYFLNNDQPQSAKAIFHKVYMNKWNGLAQREQLLFQRTLSDHFTESIAKVVKLSIHTLWHFFVLLFEDKRNRKSKQLIYVNRVMLTL